MKLFKKVLSTIISVGMLFSVASLSIFAIPTNLDECCTELDRVLSQEDKDAIKQDSIYRRGSYIYNMVHRRDLGAMIRDNWLYLPSDTSVNGIRTESQLARSLIAHGAGFLDETPYVMVGIVLENYSHYLNGDGAKSIEDLVIDHWFNFFDHYKPRDEFQRMMAQWKERVASRGRISCAVDKTDGNCCQIM